MGGIKHRFVALDFINQQLHHIDENNPAANWSVPSSGALQDMQLAGDDRLVVSRHDGWCFMGLADGADRGGVVSQITGIASLRLLPGGGVMTGVNAKEGIELYELDDRGKVRHAYQLHGYRDLRTIRQTPQGTWLVAHFGGAVEVELDGQAKALRSFSAPNVKYAFQASRAPDGNYLLSGGYAKATFVLTPENQCLRSFAGVQPPGLESYFYSGFQQLANGHLVQANWNGHNDSDYKHGLKLFEFDAKGDTVWTWIAPKEQVGAITTFIVLDGLDTALAHDDANGVLKPVRLSPEARA